MDYIKCNLNTFVLLFHDIENIALIDTAKRQIRTLVSIIG